MPSYTSTGSQKREKGIDHVRLYWIYLGHIGFPWADSTWHQQPAESVEEKPPAADSAAEATLPVESIPSAPPAESRPLPDESQLPKPVPTPDQIPDESSLPNDPADLLKLDASMDQRAWFTLRAQVPIARVRAVAFSPDSQRLFVAGEDKSVLVFRRIKVADGNVQWGYERTIRWQVQRGGILHVDLSAGEASGRGLDSS